METSKLLGLAFLVPVLVGCTSVSSTFITRDEPNLGWQEHPRLQGIPITLNVPTHLKVYVHQKHYVRPGKGEKLEEIKMGVPIHDFSHELLYTDKIFTVDFKRPGAGTSNVRVTMDENQYFEKIQQDITDETIKQVTGLFKGPFGGKPLFSPIAVGDGSQDGSAEKKPKCKEYQSLVGVGVFEIDSPTFEIEVMTFLNSHMNNCHGPPSLASPGGPVFHAEVDDKEATLVRQPVNLLPLPSTN